MTYLMLYLLQRPCAVTENKKKTRNVTSFTDQCFFFKSFLLTPLLYLKTGCCYSSICIKMQRW